MRTRNRGRRPRTSTTSPQTPRRAARHAADRAELTPRGEQPRTELEPRATARIDLAGRHQLVVQSSPDVNILQLFGQNGQVCLSIEITEAGPILRFEGAFLRLQAVGDLAIEAERLALVGRSGLILESGRDLHVRAERDLTSEARIQNITAVLGNVNVRANDDVRIDGERVRVNCVDT